MTTEEQAFLRAIVADPSDLTARLVYADWLEERGDPRGEFVRVQMELSGILPDPPCTCESRFVPHADECPHHQWVMRYYSQHEALRRLERELLSRHGIQWLRDDVYSKVPDPSALEKGLAFRRGFVEHIETTCALWCGEACPECGGTGEGRPQACVDCHGTGAAGALGPAVVLAAPVTRVVLTGKRCYHANAIAAWGWSRGNTGDESPYHLPPFLYDMLPEPDRIAPPVGLWNSEQAALDALSRASITFARSAAGLPALTPSLTT